MNILLWILAGALVGWLGYRYFGFNEARGRIAAIIIGAAGGFVGGHLVAPVFMAAAVPGEFQASAMWMAAAVAAVFVAASNLIQNRWNV